MYYIPSNLDYPVAQLIKLGSKLEKCISDLLVYPTRFAYAHIYRKDVDSYVYLNTIKIEK